MNNSNLRNRSESKDGHCNKCASLINKICAVGLEALESSTIEPCFYNADDFSRYLLRCIFETYSDKHKLYIKPTVVSDGRYDHYNNRYSGDYDLTTFIVNGDSDILLINGEAGIGKSAFIRELYLATSVYSLRNNCSILPLLFNAEEFGSDSKTPDEWVKCDLAKRYKYLDFEPTLYNPNICVVFFIDAINDIQYTDYNDFYKKLDLWQSYVDSVLGRYRNVKIVISSRYLEYLSNFEIRNYTRLFIKPLDDNQVSSFVNYTVLNPYDRIKIQEFVKKNVEMPFLRIPFYLNKVLSASFDNLNNKTDVINMFIDSLFQKSNRFIRERKVLTNYLGKRITDIRLNNTTFLDAMGKLAFDCQGRGALEFDINKIESIVHEDSQYFLDIAINNSIFNKSGNKFEHSIFQEYFSGRYVANSLPEKFRISDLLVFESEIHLLQSLKHVYNFISDKERFIQILLDENKFEIAAECVIENSDVRFTQIVANNIIDFFRGKNLLTPSKTPNLGILLGRLGDTRFPIDNENSFEPLTAYIPRLKLRVGVFPITNREYSFFINDDGYNNPHFWPSPADCWFDREKKIHSILSFWKDIQKKLNANSNTFFDFCLQNKFDKELIANFVYFKQISVSDLEAMIRDLYNNERDSVPLMWNNPVYSNPSQPVVGISWFEALAYCMWLSQKTGKHYRLLTAQEWETVASSHRRNYVYGNKFNRAISNTLETGLNRITVVGICTANCTAEGIYDLTGNIFEWTSSVYNGLHRGALYTQYICKGGSWIQPADRASSAYIGRGMAWVRNLDLGFRVCLDEN